MGNTSYDIGTRSLRAETLGFSTKSVDQIFTQQRERKAHPSMDPKNIKVRECRDSEAHPSVVPVIIGLDLTGSMSHIPHSLIKDGLPTLMGGLIQKGVDASLCFIGVGDITCDSFPLQVAQFESGDEELDSWLCKTFLEGGGGANAGESYNLAWQFADSKVETDAWSKRKQKGYLFTIGDEPVLKTLSSRSLEELYGEPTQGGNTEDILANVQEKFHVYHLHILHSSQARGCLKGWKDLLGQACIEVPNYKDVPKIITDLIAKGCGDSEDIPEVDENRQEPQTYESESML